jgi:hypothetical protein
VSQTIPEPDGGLRASQRRAIRALGYPVAQGRAQRQRELATPTPTPMLTKLCRPSLHLAVIGLWACTAAGTSPGGAQEVAVAVDPPAARVLPGATASFRAVVSGAIDTAVSWSVQEGPPGGSVSLIGLYTAPSRPAPTTSSRRRRRTARSSRLPR